MGISAVSLLSLSSLSTWLKTNRKTNCKSGWAGCAQRLITIRAARLPARVCHIVSALCHGIYTSSSHFAGNFRWCARGALKLMKSWADVDPNSIFRVFARQLVCYFVDNNQARCWCCVVNIKSHARNTSLHPPTHLDAFASLFAHAYLAKDNNVVVCARARQFNSD